MSVLTPSRLQTLQRWPHLSKTWHFLAATALSVSNRASEIPLVYQYALKQESGNQSEQLLTAKFRESILKSAALIGIPRTINGLTKLMHATPEHLRATKLLRPDKADFRNEGHTMFGQVYGKITTRVRTNMHNAYPDLDWFVENFVYGPLLSQGGSVLSPKETSLAVVAALVPQNADPQLRGHLKGALNNGATVEEVNSVREMVMELMEAYGHTFTETVSKL